MRVHIASVAQLLRVSVQILRMVDPTTMSYARLVSKKFMSVIDELILGASSKHLASYVFSCEYTIGAC